MQRLSSNLDAVLPCTFTRTAASTWTSSGSINQSINQSTKHTFEVDEDVHADQCDDFGVTFGRNTTRLSWDSSPDSGSWGNLLSPYWEARGVAALAGKEFEFGGFSESFLGHLPGHSSVVESLKKKDWTTYCTCKTQYSHECNSAWTQIRSLIQDDTQEALLEYEQSTHQGLAKDEAEPEKDASSDSTNVEVLVQLRLEFNHRQVRWPGKSFYEKLPKEAKKVTLMHMPYTDEQIQDKKGTTIHQTYDKPTQQNITILLQGYETMLKDICGDCEVIRQHGTQYHDFVKIARHPGPVFCMGSSYCLWAAMANKHGPVYLPTVFAKGEKPTIPGGQGKGVFWNNGAALASTEIKFFQLKNATQILEWANSH